MTEILYAVGVLAALGAIFGVVLTVMDNKFHVEIDPRVEEVRACLGGANCGACGYPGCDAYAQAVVDGDARADACPPGGNAAAQEIARIVGVDADSITPMVATVLCQGTIGTVTDRYIYDGYHSCRVAAGIAGGPKECEQACIGLGDCVAHCAFGAITMRGGIATIDENLCRACGMCVNSCPRNVIKMMPVSAKVSVRCRNCDNAKHARSACLRACIGCGRCTKACENNAIEVRDGVAVIDWEKCVKCGGCAKVCPCKCIVEK